MSTSNKGRREFLKKAGIGSAGLGLMLTAMGASNPAFAKMSYKYTSNHVDKVINKIKLSQPSKKSQVAFLSTVENINDLLFNEKDEGALKVFEYTQNLLKKLDPYSFGSNADGLLNLPLEFTDVLVGGYLASAESFSFGTYDKNELKRSFAKIQDLEPGFIELFAKRLQDTINSDSEVLRKFDGYGRPFLADIIKNNNQTSFQNRLIDPVTLTWVIIIIVVVVIAVFAALFGEKA